MIAGTFPFPLRTVFFAVFFAAAGQAVAQKPKVLLYRERMAQAFDTVDVVKNALKVNPVLLLRGEIPLHYERALTNRLSGIVGIGMTWRSYLNFNLKANEVDDYGEGTTIIPKPSFHLAARYYFSDDLEPQGTYAELAFAHLDFWRDVAAKDSSRQLTDTRFRDKRAYNDLRFLMGWQALSATSNWLFDLYGGIGLRDRHMLIVVESLNAATTQYSYAIDEVDDVVPSVFLGFRVGVGF